MPDIIPPFVSILNMVFSPYSAALFVIGAVSGIVADFLSRRIGIRSEGTFRRRVITSLIPAFFAVVYGNLLQGRWPDLFASADPFQGGYPILAVHFFALFVLFTAALTDFDDYIIPDLLMIPATVAVVVFMTIFPASLPAYRTVWTGLLGGGPAVCEGPLSAFSFEDPLTAAQLEGIASLVWLGWCAALLDRRWYPKLGFKRAGTLFLRHLRRSRLTGVMAVLAVIGITAIGLLCRFMPETVEPGSMGDRLGTALIGLGAGMGVIWIVRIAGRLTLGREAMGFGDVVLMGFIGCVTGWQGAVIVFFLAPFAGLAFGLIRALFRTEKEIPYGPFLCLATIALWLFWPALWEFTEPVLSDGRAVLYLGGIAAVLLVFLLGGIRLLKSFIFR